MESFLFQKPIYQKSYIRYYVLIIFSLLGFMQALFWNIFGPIYESAADSFHWGAVSAILLPNWGPIMFIIGVIPLTYILYEYGLRISMLLASGFMASGAILRCIPTNAFNRTIMIHVGAVLNGLTGILVLVGPPIVSAIWFPPDERNFSTSIAVMMNCIGLAFSFIVGPISLYGVHPAKTISTVIPIEILDYRIDMQLFVECGLAVGLFVICFLYLPAKPTLPPCPLTSEDRLSLRNSFNIAVRNRGFLISCTIFSFTMGIYCAYLGILPTLLAKLNVSEVLSDEVTFGSLIVASIMTAVIGYLSDKFGRVVPQRCLLVIMTLAAAWNSLIVLGISMHSTASLLFSQMLLSIGVLGGAPLWYETACEISYPATEELVGGFLASGLNTVMTICLCITLIPKAGITWMPAAMTVIFFFLIPLAFTFTEGDETRKTSDDMAASLLQQHMHQSGLTLESEAIPWAVGSPTGLVNSPAAGRGPTCGTPNNCCRRYEDLGIVDYPFGDHVDSEARHQNVMNQRQSTSPFGDSGAIRFNDLVSPERRALISRKQLFRGYSPLRLKRIYSMYEQRWLLSPRQKSPRSPEMYVSPQNRRANTISSFQYANSENSYGALLDMNAGQAFCPSPVQISASNSNSNLTSISASAFGNCNSNLRLSNKYLKIGRPLLMPIREAKQRNLRSRIYSFRENPVIDEKNFEESTTSLISQPETPILSSKEKFKKSKNKSNRGL